MPEFTTFGGRVLLLGFGTVGRPALALLIEMLGLPPERITLLDQVESRHDLPPGAEAVTCETSQIVPDNLDEVMRAHVGPGDLLLNLSVGICSIALSDWCQHNGVLYIDTALEPWEELLSDPRRQPPEARTEYALHETARKQGDGWPAGGPTAVFTHGANPGLVSHFAKAALLEVAEAMALPDAPPRSQNDWARLARTTGTKVIHISERDTQISSLPRQPGEFVNTWSIPGFVEEAMMPIELGWGTHEKRLPDGACRHAEGPRNTIYFPRAAANFLLRSWVPLGGRIAGVALPHSESITISQFLTLHEGGAAVYRPTVVFVYLPCDAALASLHETLMRDWEIPEAQRIMNDDIISGMDELGVLLLGHGLNGWWYGSQLDIEESRRLVPGSNPTAIQVAAGAVAAAAWAMANPTRGYCEPEDLPHEQILRLARPYLGSIASQPTDWTPRKTSYGLFDEPWRDPKDPWQFANFLA